MKILTWEEIRNNHPKDILTEKEITVYDRAVKDFNERTGNMTSKQLKKFASKALGFSSMRYARQFADPHKQPNLYKKVYQLIFDFNYNN